jgi:phage shock protein A
MTEFRKLFARTGPGDEPRSVGRSAAEDAIEQLEAHIEHLGETLAEIRRERDELHRMVSEGRAWPSPDGDTHRRAEAADEVAEVLNGASGLDLGLNLAGRVAQLIEQRDLARSEAQRYARLAGLEIRGGKRVGR